MQRGGRVASVIFVRFTVNQSRSAMTDLRSLTAEFHENPISCSRILECKGDVVSDLSSWFAGIRTRLTSAYLCR